MPNINNYDIVIFVMKAINISTLIKKYGPGYVAKNKKSGKIIASAKRLDLLFQKVGKNPILLLPGSPKAILNMSLEFPFEYAQVEGLGKLFYPMV